MIITMDTAEIIDRLRKADIPEDQIEVVMRVLHEIQIKPECSETVSKFQYSLKQFDWHLISKLAVLIAVYIVILAALLKWIC